MFYAILMAAASLSGVLKVLLVANLLSVENFGVYSLILASATPAMAMISFGYSEVLMINGTLLRNKTRVYNLLYTTIYKFIFWSSIIFFISVACLFYLLFFYYLSLALAAAVFTISTLLFNVTCTHFRAQKHFNKFALSIN